ncbi:MAG: 5-formyltetrahydrofolate cyclo-ligase [Nitrosopumilales archaeon]|nr:MAG: 5-formyltetrahydrofolate cyclo-ligase [Nitrosopumilales archaeon]
MPNSKKSSLRKVLLEKRDSISDDLMKIASEQIHQNLKKIAQFRLAKRVGSYYPIGSEVLTQDIMQELLSEGKEILLPKVVENNLEFRKIKDFSSLEKGNFDIMEPKDNCPASENLDVVLVPTIGIDRNGLRLGYGYGFYDRFLSKNNVATIALTYAKQIIKSIPHLDNDVKIDWVVTEDEFFKTS